MSIKFELFTCKEHYLAFRKAFANAVNDDKLVAAHYVLLNLLRDKPIHRGFTIITRPSKLLNGHEPHRAFKNTVEHLQDICRPGIDDKPGFHPSYWVKQRTEFLEPLEGTVDVEMLNKLYNYLPEVDDIYPWTAKGADLITGIIEHNLNEEDFWEEVIHVD